jgi:hypothetical protein
MTCHVRKTRRADFSFFPIIVGFAGCIALAGCMSGGSTGFGGTNSTLKPVNQTQDDLREVPFDVASSGEAATTGMADARDNLTNEQRPVSLVPDAADAVQPIAYATPTEIPSRQITGLETLTAKPLSPEAQALRARTEAKMASISSSEIVSESQSEEADLWGERGELPYPEATDPAELEAQDRIPALHASIEHGQCKNGWGPTPKMLNAKRVTPGHPYYMEMRLRHTPMLPVGHVYIAYGRMNADGQPLDEKLIMLAPIGGYVGAGVASTVPMPGIVEPHPADCAVTPEAAYRISLNAQDYEKLLFAIKDAKREVPSYHLFAYNCNHFMSDIAKSVGILPPENIYQPSLVYFYEMVDRNEGHKIPRTPAIMTASAYPSALRQ